MNYEHIDTLLLDLGGVLIDVDYQRTAKEFEALGHGDFDRLYTKAKQDSLFDDLETGVLDTEGFCGQVRSLVSEHLSDDQIIHGWNAMLGSIPPERIELLLELRKKYKLLLLSNTNAIHVPAFEKIIKQENGIEDFKGLFEGAYYSCEIGLRKPHAEAFHFVLDKHSADPTRTLFIDDSIQHVEGAIQAGVQAKHLELDKEDVIQFLERHGL